MAIAVSVSPSLSIASASAMASLQALLGRRRSAGEGGDELAQLAFRQGAHEAVDRPAVLEGVDRGDRLDAHLRRQLLVLVDVDLDQADAALLLAHDLFQRRAELLARAAPRRPEIDDHRRGERGVDDILHEGGGRGIRSPGRPPQRARRARRPRPDSAPPPIADAAPPPDPIAPDSVVPKLALALPWDWRGRLRRILSGWSGAGAAERAVPETCHGCSLFETVRGLRELTYRWRVPARSASLQVPATAAHGGASARNSPIPAGKRTAPPRRPARGTGGLQCPAQSVLSRSFPPPPGRLPADQRGGQAPERA